MFIFDPASGSILVRSGCLGASSLHHDVAKKPDLRTFLGPPVSAQGPHASSMRTVRAVGRGLWSDTLQPADRVRLHAGCRVASCRAKSTTLHPPHGSLEI